MSVMTGQSESAIIKVEGLTRKFGSLVAVDDVDIEVPTGELHSIIGPNGAGKTTLFNMIAGTLSPSNGHIYFRGDDITTMSEDARARAGIVRVFQIAQIFPELSAIENLRLAAQASKQEFNPFRGQDPDLYDAAENMFTRIEIDAAKSSNAKHLSHGDKKKLEIGMGIISDPDLLLLDEPTSGVSTSETDQVMDLIETVAEERTVLLIEHDIDLVLELSDRVTVLDRGSVIAQGSPEEISSSDRVQEAYMGGY